MPERFGDYVVYERLGAGGMAIVHRAVLTGMAGFKKPVALKRLLPQFAHDETFVRAFIREARLASNLRHVNIAQTYDLGIVDDTYFIAMELCEGKDLREVLKQSAAYGEAMPPAIMVAVMMQVCEALDYAHTLCDESGTPFGIVHRDVSPSNIIVGLDGAAKLIDFGIARATASSLMTMSGQLKGKFAYIAPETLGGVFDARADLFSLGICAYELLTAAPLFTGTDDLDTLRRIREMAIPPPSRLRAGIPAEVDDVVMTALVRNPDERWQSASAMRGALGVLGSRKNLRATSADVVYWVDWLFGLGARPSQKRPTVDEPSMVIERVPDTDEHRSASSSTQIERPTPRPTGGPRATPQDRMVTIPMRPAGATPVPAGTWEDASTTSRHGARSVSAITDVEIADLDAAILAEAPAPPPGAPRTLVGVDAPPTHKSGPMRVPKDSSPPQPAASRPPKRDSQNDALASGTPHDTSEKPTNFLTLGDDYLAAAEAYRSSYQTPVPGSLAATGSEPPTNKHPALPDVARPVELPPRPPPDRRPLIILIVALVAAATLTTFAALYLG